MEERHRKPGRFLLRQKRSLPCAISLASFARRSLGICLPHRSYPLSASFKHR